MLQFNQADTAAVLILTLNENVTISDPYYLFVFTHVTTKQKVKFIKYIGQDQSIFQNRYNQFTINAAVVFEDAPVGEWHYNVYEQASSSNTDEAATGALLENGKMKLDRETEFAFTKYNQPQSYSAYNG